MKLGITAMSRGVSLVPVTEHRLSTLDLLTRHNGCAEGNSIPSGDDNLSLRSEADHAKIEATLDPVSRLQRAHDTPCDETCDLTHQDLQTLI
jgi:hypothetical protein